MESYASQEVFLFHLSYLSESVCDTEEKILRNAAGRYYTGKFAGSKLARRVALAYHFANPKASVIRVIDPFGGDGRLLEWLIEEWTDLGFPRVKWIATIWDIDDSGFESATTRLKRVAKKSKMSVEQKFLVGDSFEIALENRNLYDIVLTNPPWELLKPDRRELEALKSEQRNEYVTRLRAYDDWLAAVYPLSQPDRKFAGWGTNLSRVGLEISILLARKDGLVGAVMPASLLADSQTLKLRRHLFEKHCLLSVSHYPAETKLYDTADVASLTLVIQVNAPPATTLEVKNYNCENGDESSSEIDLDFSALERLGFVVPVSFGAKLFGIQTRLAQTLPSWSKLEENVVNGLWAGREIDETNINRSLTEVASKGPLFLKGRMIARYTVLEKPTLAVDRPELNNLKSISNLRIVWRDVSRPNQKRRLIATLAQPGWIAGNSLGVAYFRNGSLTPLLSLLGVMSSLVFEFQLRAHLATGHVSLSSLRKVAVPPLEVLEKDKILPAFVLKAMDNGDLDTFLIDAYVAKKFYNITEVEYEEIIISFNKISLDERSSYLSHFRNLEKLISNPVEKTSPSKRKKLTTEACLA